MPRASIVRSSDVLRSARVQQLEGLFDVPPSRKSELRWDVSLPIEDRPWNVGLVVGPSGCGKSTLARELFQTELVSGFDWPSDKSIVDAFPSDMGIKDITMLLSSVGFSSPPSWVRPFGVLSTGEQFRVTVARAMAEAREKLFVIDEFTSVVDRTVAQIGSAAIAKTIRRRGQKFIAVTCHYDVIDWLQPDWIFQPNVLEFQWRELQRRPGIVLSISRVDSQAWKLFKQHHYLSTDLAKAAACYVGSVDGKPCAFTAVLPFPHAKRPGWREHRTVCLPDFQGVGIGNAMSEFVAGVYRATGKPYFSTTSSPSMIQHRCRSEKWRMSREPGRTPNPGRTSSYQGRPSVNRITAGFEFVGEALPREARRFGIEVPASIRTESAVPCMA